LSPKTNYETGTNDRVQGTGHGNQVNGMRATDTTLFTCGIDDSIKSVSLESNQYQPADVKLGSQPRGMDTKDGVIVVGCVKEISVVQGGRKVSSLPVDFEPSSVSINKSSGDVAVGGTTDNLVSLSCNR
jgi:WD repeat-containing protein 1 (actin-interacting protein 1)